MPKNARDRIGAAANGRTPRSTQADASRPIPSRIVRGTSRASSAAAVRGIARNGMPNALTKQTAASPPVSASVPAAIAIMAAMSG